jgi:hypothetical protein
MTAIRRDMVGGRQWHDFTDQVRQPLQRTMRLAS